MQQINLYRHLPKSSVSWLSIRLFMIIVAFYLVFLISDSLGHVIYKHHLTKQFHRSQQVLIDAQQRLSALSAQYPHHDIPLLLTNNKDTQSCQIKFTSYLEGLSRAIPAGVWLQEINLGSNGKQITLRGNALKSHQVEDFLSRINDESIYSGMAFEIEELTQTNNPATSATDNANNVFHFVLKTKG